MCSLVTYTVQLNPSLHVYFISDKIVLKCVKTHDSRIPSFLDLIETGRGVKKFICHKYSFERKNLIVGRFNGIKWFHKVF